MPTKETTRVAKERIKDHRKHEDRFGEDRKQRVVDDEDEFGGKIVAEVKK